jgi:hypothetical protein
MLKWGLVGDMKCLFCHHSIECKEHLFFERGWSKRLRSAVMLKCLVIPIRFGWDEIVRDGEKNWKGKKLKSILCKLVFGAAVYNI